MLTRSAVEFCNIILIKWIMKNFWIAILLTTSVIMANAQSTQMPAHAPLVQFGLKGGLNVSTLNTRYVTYQPRLGYHIGGLAHMHISDKWGLQPEVVYSNQGARRFLDPEYQLISLHYVNVPIILQYFALNGLRFETGPQLGALIRGKATYRGEAQDLKNQYTPMDLSWAFGLGYLTKSNWGVDVRYNMGLSNVNMDSNLPKRNKVLQAGVFYQFGPR
jgi:hypothetical protein